MKKLNVNIYNITYNKNNIILKIDKYNYDKVNKFYVCKIVKYYGTRELLLEVKKEKVSLLYFFLVLILIFFYTRLIISIDVLTNSDEIYRVILNGLDKEGVEKYSFILSEKRLQEIEEIILGNNKDLIEWINIERTGMKYVINVQPKVDKNKNVESEYCNVVSTKDAIISRIITSKGVEIKDVNDSVNKGDIIISGDIIYNDETKSRVCASGVVYGHTWYTINISVPRTYEKKEELKKSRYNVLIKYNNSKYKVFKSRLDNYIEKNKMIVNIFGLEIYLQKEVEVKEIIKEYSDDELNELLDKLISDKMKNILKGESNIIDRKVLKKEANDSKMDIEVFIVAEEEISSVITYDIDMDT